jgi:hypothetical protein
MLLIKEPFVLDRTTNKSNPTARQATAKMSKHTSDFRRARSSVASIQMYAKGMIARDRFQSIAASVEKIQSVFKYILALRQVRVAKDEWYVIRFSF